MALEIANDACVDSLIAVWRRVVNRVYHFYQLSATSYFTYLNLNGQVYVILITSIKTTLF